MRDFGVDRLTITTLTENYVDMLLPDEPNVTRAGLAHHFDPKQTRPLGENGISLVVEAEWGRYSYRTMFDTGMTGRTLLHNAGALGIDVQALDHLVLSHGHPDHYGGPSGLLGAREIALPVSMHPAAFDSRYLRLASGQVAPYFNHDLTEASINDAGGRPALHVGPLEIGPGMLATGAIPREVDFEMPPSSIDLPNAAIQLRAGRMCADEVPDDQALVLSVGADGIVVARRLQPRRDHQHAPITPSGLPVASASSGCSAASISASPVRRTSKTPEDDRGAPGHRALSCCARCTARACGQ